ncbi:hypothetical protein J4220_02840 [Candidatus Micrarchaeota archaeon]|nr:hypothetical protein [Candidatus Micrarchaeota archaeon]
MRLKALVAIALLLSLSQAVFAEDNQTAVQEAEKALPDLFFETIKTPAKAVAGNEVFITAGIKNAGSADAAPFFAYLYALPQFFAPKEESVWNGDCTITKRQGYFTNRVLQPGQSVQLTFGVSCKKPGTKKFLLKADFFNKVKESEEDNNIAKVAIEFESGPQTDCADSDGGVTPFEKGLITQGKKTGGDYCSGKFLREYYCNKNGNLANQVMQCEKGCLNGACQK